MVYVALRTEAEGCQCESHFRVRCCPHKVTTAIDEVAQLWRVPFFGAVTAPLFDYEDSVWRRELYPKRGQAYMKA